MKNSSKKLLTVALPLAVLPACLTACADKQDKAANGGIEVTQKDDSCQLSSTDLNTGSNTFNVTNKGSKINEFYILTNSGRVEGEVENIGPGATRKLLVELRTPGEYKALCKPGMVGDGITQQIKVTGDTVDAAKGDAALQGAVDNYLNYARSQANALQEQTDAFVSAIHAGDVEKAKALYAQTRTPYERIEPIAETFPNDLDPRVDQREADVAPGEKWTGFHRIEKDLWEDKAITEDTKATADQLQKDIKELTDGINDKSFTVTPVQISTGSQGLLDEIARTKITGEEDIFSHTDLYDFQANLEGSRAAVAALETPLNERSKGAMDELTKRFDAVQAELNKHRNGDQFVSYDQVSEQDRKALSVALDNLTEKVSKIQEIIAK